MSGKYTKYIIALSDMFVCCVLSQVDDAAGMRETESKLKFLLDCSLASERQSFLQIKHIQPKRNLGKNKLILSAFLEFLPALYSGENLSTEIQFLTAMISQRKNFFGALEMNILQSAFWLLYLLLCSLLLQGRTCTLADFFGHIFISIVLLFVRMPSLAFSSATCQEEWGVVLAIWTRSNLITPSALTRATNLVTFKTKINTTGFRNICNTFVDH